MRSRLTAGLLAVAALAAAGVGISGAAFIAVSANPGNDFATAATFPTVSMDDPGTPLRGTVALTATTAGAIVSVTIQRSPAGAGTWTDVCTDSSNPYSCSFDTTGVGDGLYDLRATADTGSGPITSATVANRRVDNTNPAVTMTDPGANLRGTISLGATATDTGGSGVASVTIQRSPAGAGTWTDICTDTTSPYSCNFDTTGVADGLYDFRAVGTDNAGNSANSTVANRRVDNTAPTAGQTDPGSPLRGTVTVNATGTDTGGSGVANVKIQRSPAGAGTWTDICTDTTSPYSCNFDTTGVADGLYDLRAVSTDNAGNTATSATIANRRVDNTNPAVTMTDPGTPLSGTISLGATATDTGGSGVASVTIQRSPAGAGTWTDVCTDPTSPYSCSFDTTSVGDGLYDFRAVGTDNAGNTANSTVANRRVDNVAPSVSITDPGANLRGTIAVDATASDGGGILNVKIQRSPAGAGTWTDICTDTTSPYSCNFDTTGVADGLYDLRALATDNASRTATSTVTNRRVDNTLPTATMTDPGSPLRLTVTLNATSTDTGGSGVSSVTIQRSPAGAGTWTDVCTDTTSPYSCSFDTTGVADGLYDLRAVSIDVAGNPNTSSTVANRRVDNTAPTAGLTDPGSPLRLTVTLNATGTDTGGSGVANVKIQRSPAGAGTWTDICTDTTSPYSCSFDTTGVADGSYDLRAVSADNAGNQTNSTTVASRIVDNTAPTATDVQTTNASGGTAGKPEAGDTIVFSFSEQIAPGTIVAGWNGTGTQTVTVTMHTGNLLSVTGATIVNGDLTLGGAGYVNNGKTVVFSNSTIAQSGATVTITLGTPDKPQFLNTGSAGQSSWPVPAALTDVAGNAITTVTRLEITPPNDAEF
ncbi:MAG: Ig-like domain-containing protein [Gaiellaceae bacterium]